MTATDLPIICESAALESGGLGLNFNVEIDGVRCSAFVIRHNGTVFAYLNQCAHLALELDWEPGEFFDLSGDYIMCANHGAMFEPSTGECVNGPCFGAFLTQISVQESDSSVLLADDQCQLVEDQS